jgi:hypothetical protein
MMIENIFRNLIAVILTSVLVTGAAAQSAAPNRPQEPKKPYPYNEEEIAYENKRDGVKLAGTLTLPRGKGPFPAVLLITGSGFEKKV